MALFGHTSDTVRGSSCLTLEMSTLRRVAVFFVLFFPTNLHSFVSFGKTHKLHNAIDHWLAGVAGQAHVTLEAITEATGRTRRWRTAAEIWGSYGGAPRPTVGGLTKGGCCAQSEWTKYWGDEERLVLL